MENKLIQVHHQNEAVNVWLTLALHKPMPVFLFVAVTALSAMATAAELSGFHWSLVVIPIHRNASPGMPVLVASMHLLTGAAHIKCTTNNARNLWQMSVHLFKGKIIGGYMGNGWSHAPAQLDNNMPKSGTLWQCITTNNRARQLRICLCYFCSTPEVHQTSSKAGSGINILYLLTGPILTSAQQ